MATPVNERSGSSAYPLSLPIALALIVLSLWTVDSGLIEQQSAPSGGNNAVTTSAPSDLNYEPSSHLRTTSLEDLAFGSWVAIQIEPENEEVRRKATLALMVYATGNGIRR
jgi:hypothetical protein